MTGAKITTELETATTAALKRSESKPNSHPATGKSDEREREYKRGRVINDLLASIGKRYAGCRIQNFQFHGTPEVQDRQREVVDRVREYGENIASHIEAGRGVVFFGLQGTGKDHLMAALMLYAADQGYEVKYVNSRKMYEERKDQIGGAGKATDLVKELAAPDILSISDPIPFSGKLTDFELNFLGFVIEERYKNFKPTWITANFFDGEKAKAALSSQILDRLRDNALTCFFDWPSYRKPMSQEDRR